MERYELKENLLSSLMIDNKPVAKRYTEKYLTKLNLYDELLHHTKVFDEATLKERIQYILLDIEGLPSCEKCGARTKLNDKYFQRFCSLKCSSNHEAVRGKTRKTNLERYGNETHKKVVDYDTLYDLYIVQKKSLFQISKILGNISNVSLAKRIEDLRIQRRTHSENQSVTSHRLGKKFPQFNINREELVDMYVNQKISPNYIAQQYGCHPETIRTYLKDEGVDLNRGRSYIENIIVEMLKNNEIKYRARNRSILKDRKEIDFMLLDYNIGIECHGMITHSHIFGQKDELYHYNKYIQAKDKGIKLFQFWELDIVKKLPILESVILNSCKKSSTKIGARNCDVVELRYSEAEAFFAKNHIQGAPAKNNKFVGLIYDNQLVSVASYYSRKDETIISRFCSLIGYNIQGGFSKLLKQIPGNIITTYSSNDISDGDLYLNNGFTLITETTSDMWYTDYNKVYNRQKFMKSKLKDFPAYDESKTEKQIMIESGYDLIFKSGTKTWKLYR